MQMRCDVIPWWPIIYRVSQKKVYSSILGSIQKQYDVIKLFVHIVNQMFVCGLCGLCKSNNYETWSDDRRGFVHYIVWRMLTLINIYFISFLKSLSTPIFGTPGKSIPFTFIQQNILNQLFYVMGHICYLYVCMVWSWCDVPQSNKTQSLW